MNPEDERPEFYAHNLTVLNCAPGNCDHAHGEPATIITTARGRDGAITPWVISVRDSRLLAVKLIVSLATSGDEFAQMLLDTHFPADAHGNFMWPR